MSLINEALKKAQKLRTGDPADLAPMPGGGQVTKRGEARSTQQLLLISAGAILLIVLSVVVTFWFINRTPAPKTAPALKTAAITNPAETPATSPTIVPPAINPPAVVEAPAPKATTPAGTTAQPAAVAAATPASARPPITATPTPATAVVEAPERPAAEAAPAPPVPTDPRVHAFVDNLKVMGIRSSGGDSRVLMNDRVFRVNDIVERTLGVRLTNVAPDALTFTDSNGAVYVKNF